MYAVRTLVAVGRGVPRRPWCCREPWPPPICCNPLVVQVLSYEALRVRSHKTSPFFTRLIPALTHPFLLAPSFPDSTTDLTNAPHCSTVALATVYISASFSGKCLEKLRRECSVRMRSERGARRQAVAEELSKACTFLPSVARSNICRCEAGI
jgi:hypothetical protein